MSQLNQTTQKNVASVQQARPVTIRNQSDTAHPANAPKGRLSETDKRPKHAGLWGATGPRRASPNRLRLRNRR